MSELQEICDKLKADGWKTVRYPKDSKTLYYKAFPGHRVCRCNDDKNKQVEVYYYSRPYAGNMQDSFEIECAGELADGTWLKLQSYALVKPTYEIINKKVSDLLELWDKAAVGNDVRS